MERLRRLFLTPGWMVMLALFAAPMAIVLLYSVRERGVYGGISDAFTAENYARLFDTLYAVIFLRTFLLAGVATAGCLLLGFPLAWFIARAGRRRSLYLQLVMLPFWTSFLVRTYCWMFLLRESGLFNSLLAAAGLIREPLPLLYNHGAVLLGLVYGFLPFAVLPLYATLERFDPALTEAAADLGAGRRATLRHVVLPVCAPGLRAAAILVFIPCLGAYLTPDLLGGGRSVMAGNLIQNQFTTARDWPFGSAVSLALMGVSLLLLLVWMRRSREAAL